MNAAAIYPKREPFFSHRFCRLLTKCDVAQLIGAEACWLLTVIVMTEDARRYASAVTFYNGQLETQCGFDSKNRLDRHRQRAIEAGWLHYEPGGKGVPGVYWVTIPVDIETDDTHDQMAVTPNLPVHNGPTNGLTNGGKTDRETGDKRTPSYPIPVPIPNPNTNTSLPSSKPGASTGSRSGRGFDKRDLQNAGKVLAFAQSKGIDVADHRNKIRCLSVAIQARDADKPGGMFVHLIRKGAAGDWSTLSDEPHESAKQWLRDHEKARNPTHLVGIESALQHVISPVPPMHHQSAADQADRLLAWDRNRATAGAMPSGP